MEKNNSSGLEPTFKDKNFANNLQEQSDEITALQSIFNAEDKEKFKVLATVDSDNNGLFVMLVDVCPLPVCDAVHIEVALPVEQENEMAAAASKAEPPNLSYDIQFSRSSSGQNWKGSFNVKYLSPLNLFMTFPPSYPSSDPPKFQLSCPWLSQAQLESLHQALDKLWDEGNQMPIVYTWINWLENSLLSHLGISDHLILRLSLSDDDVNTKVDEVFPWQEHIGQIIASMKRYNQEQLDIEFCQNIHECQLCYDKKPGVQFFRIHECPHIFCHDCMKEFCELHVRDGTVEALRCPDRGCNSLIPPYIVQAVLSSQAYKRWEKLLLQKTLDAMSDTVYCPRCTSLVIAEAEEELHLAHCTVCYYAFCTECERSWHQGRQCQTDDEVLENLQQQQQGRNALSEAEQNRFLELRRKLEEEKEAKNLIKARMKTCPICKIKIEKIGGCNKITCKCGNFFCWICGKQIHGYSHFQSGSCNLFPNIETAAADVPARLPPDALLRIQAQLEVNPDLANRRCYCPMCKQVSLKGRDNNNHIKCWNCKTNFCFLCRQRITGSVPIHYSGPCVQHS
ncbi:unnamed protein product [Lymnaea stagnalis]|uniref:RBR-type E3 ubiquitin transferase n=1 Tax=Lymnaea stagnalis TaxID=6523 RepID=A0AAV2I3U9_LYMST